VTALRQVVHVDLAGTARLVAGGGPAAFSGDGGPAVGAGFGDVAAIAAGPQGLFVADSREGRVRLVGRDGTIETVAGRELRGTSGDGGPATEARLGRPAGLAVDAGGNLFVSDAGRVRRVDTASLPVAPLPPTCDVPAPPAPPVVPAVPAPLASVPSTAAGDAPVKAAGDRVAPRLSRLRVSGALLRFSLSEPATVTVALQPAAPAGRSRGRAAPPRRLLTRRLPRGSVALRLPAAARRAAARRGHRLALTAVDAAGNRAAAVRVTLRR